MPMFVAGRSPAYVRLRMPEEEIVLEIKKKTNTNAFTSQRHAIVDAKANYMATYIHVVSSALENATQEMIIFQ